MANPQEFVICDRSKEVAQKRPVEACDAKIPIRFPGTWLGTVASRLDRDLIGHRSMLGAAASEVRQAIR